MGFQPQATPEETATLPATSITGIESEITSLPKNCCVNFILTPLARAAVLPAVVPPNTGTSVPNISVSDAIVAATFAVVLSGNARQRRSGRKVLARADAIASAQAALVSAERFRPTPVTICMESSWEKTASVVDASAKPTAEESSPSVDPPINAIPGQASLMALTNGWWSQWVWGTVARPPWLADRTADFGTGQSDPLQYAQDQRLRCERQLP